MRAVNERILQAKKIKMTTKTASKIECLNPTTGRRMQIDKQIYDQISKAIYHSLKKGKTLTFSQIVEGVKDCFKEEGIKFDGSVDWYTITVKKDMEARKIIEAFIEKSKKLHRLSK